MRLRALSALLAVTMLATAYLIYEHHKEET